jgi:hypothetical protein
MADERPRPKLKIEAQQLELNQILYGNTRIECRNYLFLEVSERWCQELSDKELEALVRGIPVVIRAPDPYNLIIQKRIKELLDKSS